MIKGKLKTETFNYVKMMLGAPVKIVEIDDSALDMCSNEAIRFMKDYGVEITSTNLKEGTLCYATLLLGHIRCKYTSDPTHPDSGPSLIVKGKDMVDDWKASLLIDLKIGQGD